MDDEIDTGLPVAMQYVERFGDRPDARMLSLQQLATLERRMRGALATGRPLTPRDFGLDYDSWEDAAPTDQGVVL